MTVYITFTSFGSDSGPFNLYSNVDGFSSAFAAGVSKAQLLAGFPTNSVPNGTTVIRAKSFGICTNFVDLSVVAAPTTTTSTTLIPPTTTTTTAPPTTTTTTTVMISSFVKTGESSTIQSMNVFGTLTMTPNTNFEWSVNLSGTFNPFQLSDGFNSYPSVNVSGLTTGIANSGPTGVLAITILLSSPLGPGNNSDADVGFYDIGAFPTNMLPDGFQLLFVVQ